MTNTLYYGDNLVILREHVKDESVDLVYLDPPFNSNANYNVLFKAPDGHDSHAQMEAFEDTWHWTDAAEQAFDDVMKSGNADVAEMLRAMRSFLKENDMMAYLAMMAVRLIELHRVLKPTGSLYLHCDPSASHYLKILLDAVFGKEMFLNEVVWKRTGSHGSARRWGPLHDNLLFYAKSQRYTWNRVYQEYSEKYLNDFYRYSDERGRYRLVTLTGAGRRTGDSGRDWRGVNPTDVGRHWAVPIGALQKAFPDQNLKELSTQQKLDLLDQAGLVYWPPKGVVPQQKRYADENPGVTVQDIVTDILPISSQAQERLGYPTQKPVALLERILSASSNEGDVVLDPFCGCGTTVHAAQKLKRQWIGIDITHLAISLIQKRMRDAFGKDLAIEVVGVPKDVEGARALAAADKYQFQWWAVSLVDAVPLGGKKKGADSGVDGLIFFKPDGKATEKAIVSVKGGENVSVQMIRDLGHVVERDKAKIGVFITLAEPTKPMMTEAVAAGFYKTEYGQFPKLQILTIADLFDGKRPKLPWVDPTTFKKAKGEEVGESKSLPMELPTQRRPRGK